MEATEQAPDSGGGARPSTESRATRLTRADLVALVLLVASTALSLTVLLPGFYDPSISTGDGAVYLVTAKSLLAGEGYSYLGEPFTIRPPGFSWLLAGLIALVGLDYAALAAGIGLFGVLAVALLFVHARRTLALPVALAAAVAVWLNPGFQRSCSQLMSDVPGLALMVAGLVLERSTRRSATTGRGVLANLGLGALIGFAAYVRSINVFLVPALILGRLFARVRERDREPLGRFVLVRLALPSIVAVASLVPWSLHAEAVPKRVPPDHTLFHSYSVAMWHSDLADPGSPRLGAAELGERVRERVGDLASVLGSRMRERDGTALHHALAAAALLVWLGVLVVRRETSDFLIGGMVLVIAIYFGFMNRLVLPVYALLVPTLAWAMVASLRRATGQRAATWIATALLLVLAAVDFEPRWRWEPASARSETFFATCRVAERVFGEDDVLAANFGAHYSVELDRPVYTLRWALKRGGTAGALDLIERYGVTAVVLDRSLPADAKLLDRLLANGAQLVRQVGPNVLVELR